MFFVAQNFVRAQTEIASNLATVNAEVGLGTTDIRIVIARVIRIALSFLGIIAVSLMIYAGFIWMTSNGDPTKIKKAQGIMINAAVGLVIILSSLAITQFILSRLLEATGAGGPGTTSSPSGIITPLSSALGAGIIDTHYPARNQTGIPRNTNIAVTFRREMNPTTIVPEYDAANPSALSSLNTEAVRIYYVDVDDLDGDGDTDEEVELLGEEVDVGVTADNKTFVFNPNVHWEARRRWFGTPWNSPTILSLRTAPNPFSVRGGMRGHSRFQRSWIWFRQLWRALFRFQTP